jgi:hypothetical protein
MNEFLFILIGIVVIANLVYTIWSYISLRRIVKGSQDGKIKDNVLLEHIIHTRSSMNLIYASIAIITFVLTFLGFNLKDRIAQEVTKEISASAKVDLDLLRTKANEITMLDSVAVIKAKELNLINDKARVILNELGKSPQQFYVIQDLQLSSKKHFYAFSELQTINNEKLPIFSQPPALIYSWAKQSDGSITSFTPSATKDGIEFGQTDGLWKIDIVIYPRK